MVPVVAVALAIGWCVAELAASPLLAAAVAVSAVAAACGTAIRRRRRKKGLAAALIAITVVLAVLLFLLLHTPAGPRVLVLQLLIVASLTPLAPLAYALTFEDPGEDS